MKKAFHLNFWRILAAVAIAAAFWGCGDRPESAQKEAPVRKKIVLPAEDKTPSTPPVADKAAESDTQPPPSTPSTAEKSQIASQSKTVTKKMPQAPAEPAEKIAVTAPPTAADETETTEPVPVEDAKSDLKDGVDRDNSSETQPKEDDARPPVKEAEDAEDVVASDETLSTKPLETEQITDQLEPTDEVASSEALTEGQDLETGDASETPGPAESETAAAPDTGVGVSKSALASILGITQQSKKKTEGYDPSGKIDPFEPLFKPPKPEEAPPEEEPAEESETADKPRKKRRIPRTPLEKMDLNQLKLVGIIRAESGNRALVEEASGKGYIISKGTYIGIHSGQVSEILKDRVVVEEEYEDIKGEITTRKRELKIEKPPGEGYHEM